MASDVVDETAVYLTTGNPLPSDIESVMDWLLNDPFVAAFQSELLVGMATGCSPSGNGVCECFIQLVVTATGCCQAEFACSAAQAKEVGKITCCSEASIPALAGAANDDHSLVVVVVFWCDLQK